MTNHTDLIARLRKDDLFWEAPITCRSEAADALEAAQAEIDMHMRVATNAIDHVVTLKAEIEAVRKANIDCVNHFDALRIDYDKALAQLAAHSMDAPISDSPTVILAKIIHMAVLQATDPAIKVAQPAQTEKELRHRIRVHLANRNYYSHQEFCTKLEELMAEAAAPSTKEGQP